MFKKLFKRNKDHNDYNYTHNYSMDTLCNLKDDLLDRVPVEEEDNVSIMVDAYIGMITYLYHRYDSLEKEYYDLKRKLKELGGQ